MITVALDVLGLTFDPNCRSLSDLRFKASLRELPSGADQGQRYAHR